MAADLDLNGRHVLLTGGSRGLGLAMARRFGRKWEGVLLGGLGIVSVGLGLANLVR